MSRVVVSLMARLRVTLLLFPLIICAIEPATAQVSVHGGITIGANVATLRTDTAKLGYRTAVIGGVVGQLNIPGPLAVRPELLLSRKGATVEARDGNIVYKAGYLEMPLLLKGALPFLRSYRPHLLVGPAVAVKIFERQAVGGDNTNINVETDQSFFKRTDIGITAGLGGSMGAGPGALEISLRYTLGLTDVAKAVEQQPFPESPFPEEGKNGVWTLMLSFGL